MYNAVEVLLDWADQDYADVLRGGGKPYYNRDLYVDPATILFPEINLEKFEKDVRKAVYRFIINYEMSDFYNLLPK